MILREASCDSEARFMGLWGADALPNSRCEGAGAGALEGASELASESAAGAGELRNSPVKPKKPRFFDGGSMISIGLEPELELEARWEMTR
jgi:hypothetical protein